MNTPDLNQVLMELLVPRTFQKLRKWRVCCNFLIKELEVLLLGFEEVPG